MREQLCNFRIDSCLADEFVSCPPLNQFFDLKLKNFLFRFRLSALLFGIYRP
jgi:hypothetical protein